MKVTRIMSIKKYRCSRCGFEKEMQTNHYGTTWSWGYYNTCPVCPPCAKYPEFGGQTIWECVEKPLIFLRKEIEE